MIKKILFLLCFILSVISCKKDDADLQGKSSIKIIETENEPKQVKLCESDGGNLLVYVTSGDLLSPVVSQELFLLNKNGEVLNPIHLSDTIFQHMIAVKGIDGGFFVCATSNTFPYIAIYHIGDNGEILWSKSFLVKSGTDLNEPAVIVTRDNNYMVMYQSYGSGYYLWKGDQEGNEVFNKKIPTPNAMHAGAGLNYGEKYVNLFQANDTLIIVQGITYDKYGEDFIENCFIRAVDNNVIKEWYSTNFDSTHMEAGAGFAFINDSIVLFGSKAENKYYEYFGDPFARVYSTYGTYGGEKSYPRVDGSPTVIRRSIPSPDGGYLLIGSNNQYSQGELVSPNRIILIKTDQNISQSWSRSITSEYPSKGFDAAYLSDGSIGLIGLIKEKFQSNRLIYFHLDANGNIINN